MPEKTVREMSTLERKHRSLAARVFHAAAIHSVILGLLCFLIGFGMYLNALARQSMKEVSDLAHDSLSAVGEEVDPGVYAARTMEIYRTADSPEEDEDAYYARFEKIAEDPGYQKMREILCARRTADMSDFFFAVPDEKAGRLIFVADTDPRPGHVYPIGRQMKVPGWFQRFFFRMGKDSFPRTYFFRPNKGVICVSGAYIREGDPSAGFLFVVIRIEDTLRGVRSFTLQYVVAILFAIVVMGYLLTRRMKRTLVRPIDSIAEAAQAYVRDKRSGVRETDHFSGLNIRTGDEIENLSLVMADMERDLSDYEENLTKITAEKERISVELHMATQIQEAMLPNIFPAFPDRPEFDIYATMEPAKEVGGDFYDFFLIDEDHLCMVVADVSGKGVPAALFMMASKIILSSCAMLGNSAAEILTRTNEAICSNNREEMFITVWLGILEISTGTLTAANAGHEYPVLKKPEGGFRLVKDRHGLVIGGMEGMRYREYTCQIEPGTKLFLYTDGLPEATNGAGEMFGTERMLTALNRKPDAPPDLVLKHVRAAVGEFVREAEQFDDLTMLCIEYKGKEKPKAD